MGQFVSLNLITTFTIKNITKYAQTAMVTEMLIAKPELGKGIYTIPDISALLGLPNHKVNRWIKTFWDERLGADFKSRYSWNVEFTKAINFYTLIEIYTFYRLSEAGCTPAVILDAHQRLSKKYKTPYPFAKRNVLKNLKTEGRKVLFTDSDGGIYSLDNKQQFYLGVIKDFLKNLDFDDGNLATRLWPLGKDKHIVCDPHHQFGQPIVSGTNIPADIIAEMNSAGDSIDFISKTYNISKRKVEDAIFYGSQAA